MIGDPTQGYLYASGSVGLQGTTSVRAGRELPGSPRSCPDVPTRPSPARWAWPTIQGLRRQLGGGFDGIKPETGKGWSVGADFAPPFMPGFVGECHAVQQRLPGRRHLSQSQLDCQLGRAAQPAHAVPERLHAAADRRLCQYGQWRDSVHSIPAAVYFLLDQNSGNVLNLQIQGLDVELNYEY